MSDEQPQPLVSHEPHCINCAERIKLNPKAVGLIHTDGSILSGWHHHDGMKRDHQAYPHDLRSSEDEITRVGALMDQARMQVRSNMKAAFAELRMRDSVDDIFNDRRKS